MSQTNVQGFTQLVHL